MPILNELIEQLGTTNERERRRAGDALLLQHRRALPVLRAALRHTEPRIRQSAAFLLGRLGEPEIAPALAATLNDDDPKVRKNAAVSLGRLGGPDQLAALADALGRETITWVRPSLVLALGALGGDSTYALLTAIEPHSDEERDALRKALDRTTPSRPVAAWVAGGWRPACLLEMPLGLERIAQDEALALGLPLPTQIDDGRLRLARDILPDRLTARLRCSYGPLLLAGDGPALPLQDAQACADQVAFMVTASQTLRRWREWIAIDGSELRFRLAFGPHVRATTLRTVLQALRVAAAPLGLVDSPSRYVIELVVESDQQGARLLVRPSFSPDGRFSYREQDVPAAIDPVVAAGLARIVRTRTDATIFDPTCGSGTLLIERAKLGGVDRLFGLDIEPAAISAATANLYAAEYDRMADLAEGDAADLRNWPDCDEVLANLPFGLRTRTIEPDLEGLYDRIARNLRQALRPGGRAILYTAQPTPLEIALDRAGGLQPDGHLRIFAGGLWVSAIVAQC
jgi:hypothetical protein